MNLMLIGVTIVLVSILSYSDVLLIRKVYQMTDTEIDIIFGGIGKSGLIFNIWCTTFVLSGIGITGSFQVLAMSPTEVTPVLIFTLFNIALIVYNQALIGKNVLQVAICLTLILCGYMTLFVYMLDRFPVITESIHEKILLYFLHICNAISVFHAFILDAIIWQFGWWERIDYEDE